MGARKWFIALVDVSVSISKCFGERTRAFERIFANEHINHLLILRNFVHEHAKCSTWSSIEGNLWAVIKQETKWNETGSHSQNIDSDCVVATEDHRTLPWLCSTAFSVSRSWRTWDPRFCPRKSCKPYHLYRGCYSKGKPFKAHRATGPQCTYQKPILTYL